MTLPLVSLNIRASSIRVVIIILPSAGEDYVAVNKSISFYPGYGTVQCVHIPILNDECLEDDIESFNMLISSNDDDCVVIGATSSEVQVYIRDDDGKFIAISQLWPATFACPLHHNLRFPPLHHKSSSGILEHIVLSSYF